MTALESSVRVTLIAALARHRVLGRDGSIPWRLPADLRRFKQRTMGHPLVMGRKTWESIGRPLPGRRMVVITRQPGYPVPDEVEVVPSLEAALQRAEALAQQRSARQRSQDSNELEAPEGGEREPEIFIAGGGEIYRQALPRADRLDLTEVDLEVDGDTYFPEIDEGEWREVSREEHPPDGRNPHPHRFRVLERRSPRRAEAADHDSRRFGILALLATAELLGMSLWFTASAVSPQLRELWGLSASQAGWLTGVVQLGFVAGTAVAAVLNLADVIPARRYFAVSALLGALANASLLVAPGFYLALGARFLTGFFLAGVYPPAMKMIATWFRSARGLAIGTVVGALTLGKATPYLVKALGGATLAPVVLAASTAALAASLLVAVGYREGPYPFARRPFSWSLAGTVLAHRPTRLATAGYLGHMWELYAMWTWVPVFLAAALGSSTAGDPSSPQLVDALAFGAIAAGGLGCVWGGWYADRAGRERTVNLSMAISGACCLGVGLIFGASPWVLAAVTWVWGFFVVADSAQFSALVTEVAPRHAVGTALTLQTSMGFLLTLATIQWVPVLAESYGWRWAFPILALGPAAGIWAIRRLRRLHAAAP